MKSDEIIGLKEGQKLEFKRAEVASNPDTVVREAVGMLNATGGRILIGVIEENGVAHALEDVPEAARLADSLRNRILDSVHPRDEADRLVKCDVESVDGKSLVVVEVTKRAKIPCVFSRSGALYPLKRFDDRLRPLTYEQVIAAITNKALSTPDKADEKIEKLVGEFRKDRGPLRGFWIGMALENGDDEEVFSLGTTAVKDRIVSELSDPRNVEIRRDGFTWWSGLVHSIDNGPRLRLRRIECGRQEPPFKLLRVRTNGDLTLAETTDRYVLIEGSKTGIDSPVLMPFSYVEYTVSLFRLAAWLWKECAQTIPDCGVRALMLFEPADGTCLPQGKLGPFYDYAWLRPTNEEEIYIDVPFASASEIIDKPDASAFRLISRFYEAYGHPETSVPFFDTQTDKFIIP